MSPIVVGSTGPDFGDQIIEAARARRSLILAGPNTNDLFLGPSGFVYVRELVALRHAAEGRAPVVCSGHGVVQDPVPGQGPAALRLPPADAPPGQALRELCDALRSSTQPVVVIVDFADLRLPAVAAGSPLAPDQQLLVETLVRFPVDSGLRPHRLVVISRADGLDQRLARFPGWEVIPVDLPSETLRTIFARRLEERHRTEPAAAGPVEPGLTPERFGRDCGGLTLDDMMRGSLEAAEREEQVTRRWVHETKLRRLRQRSVDGLDVYPRGVGLAAVAGLPQIRLFIKERQATGTYPRAIVLAGPAGVGKTTVVQAIADENGWPAVALGNVRSMWQGETEARTRNILATARAMAPIVFHIDEAPEALGQRDAGGPSADSGTGARILAEFWTFLGDTVSDVPILFVLTTNRPDLLDTATRSRSEIIPILHATPSEQIELLRLACTRLGWPISREMAKAAIAESGLDLLSGRMIVKAAQRADINARLDGATELQEIHLTTSFAELLERLDPIDDERMALKALGLASFTPYLPWVAAARLGEPVEILPYVAPLLESDGSLNRQRLDARSAELDAAATRRQVSRRG
jgi:ATPase family associated with various cellular activities (AAA)